MIDRAMNITLTPTYKILHKSNTHTMGNLYIEKIKETIHNIIFFFRLS